MGRRSVSRRNCELVPKQGQGLTPVGRESGRVQAVVDVIAAALADDQVGSAEHRQVLRDSGLGYAELGDEGVHAERVSRL